MIDCKSPYLRLSKKFIIRNEKGCSFLVRLSSYHDEATGGSIFYLPSFAGYIISEIGKEEIEESIRNIAGHLGVSSDSVSSFVESLLRDEIKWLHLPDGSPVKLPADFLVWSDTPDLRSFYYSSEFDPMDDFRQKRPEIPLSVNLMITTACTTDCAYCYADRSIRGQLSDEEIIGLIKELHAEGVPNLTITGGDIFAMKGWKRILEAVGENSYGTFISTKTPLAKESLETLIKLGYDHLQFSLDSVDAAIETKLVKVRADYIDNVKAMFSGCRELGMKVQVRTVITSLNYMPEVLGRLHEFLKESGCVAEWDITPAFLSGYREDYSSYKVSPEQLETAYDYCMRLNSKQLPISFSKMTKGKYKLKKASTTEDFCRINQQCLAGYTAMSVLANGKVTFCEMLYENPYYLYGNIKEKSLKELWHSDVAMKLFSPEKPHPDSSPCGKCESFDKCKRDLKKRVCYVDIAKTNGEGDTRHLPDPRCPMAPDVDYIL